MASPLTCFYTYVSPKHGFNLDDEKVFVSVLSAVEDRKISGTSVTTQVSMEMQ